VDNLDKWWSESPYERRPNLPERAEEHVPLDLQFQRYAHDANLGKPTSELMRLSPSYYQRFGATDTSIDAHLAERLMGLWDYLEGDYTPSRRFAAEWAQMCALAEFEGALGDPC
jgi:hypothetical protein